MAGVYEEDETIHRKRLAQILRYISTMYEGREGRGGHSFVREEGEVVVARGRRPRDVSDFFQKEAEMEDYSVLGDVRRCGVLFSTDNFRNLLAMESEDKKAAAGPSGAASPPRSALFEKAPFSFYAAAASSSVPSQGNNRPRAPKRTLTGTLKTALTSSRGFRSRDGDGGLAASEKGYWLRVTRLANQQLSRPVPSQYSVAVDQYVRDWLTRTREASTIEELITLDGLKKAPKLPPTVSIRDRRQIKSFLRQYRTYLCKKLYCDTLSPIYYHLFEWIQHQQDHLDELVFGLGHARMLLDDGSFVAGPLLEVLVEVELATDGAIMVRPREHTGVTINRQVVTAISRGGDASETISRLHKDVAELEPSFLSPGQPSTYVPLLRRIAVEISPGGTFQPSAKSNRTRRADEDLSKLVVSEAWGLYSRPRPSSVWARDANAFADQLVYSTTCNRTNIVVPKATWSITHGPGALEKILEESKNNRIDERFGGGVVGWLRRSILGHHHPPESSDHPATTTRPLFPLPTSDTQNRIAELLIDKEFPAVVCEGPPGTGKTHSIANIICAYLCQGKRVLVTSKNAPALSVLRDRLPDSVAELCVDISGSELSGMRQLQKTVERLANRVACVNPDLEERKRDLLQENIGDLEAQLKDIDERIRCQSDRICDLLRKREGERLVELSLLLIKEAPWLLKSIASWEVKQLISLQRKVSELDLDDEDPIHDVSSFSRPPARSLVSYCNAMAGSALSYVSVLGKRAVASTPVIGSLTGMEDHNASIIKASKDLRLQGGEPSTKSEWEIVTKALSHAQALHWFEQNTWKSFQRCEGWPEIDFTIPKRVREVKELLSYAVELKMLISQLDAVEEIQMSSECRALDATRTKILYQVQHCAEELVDTAVMVELGRSFSPEAQSALIQFAQIAGKAKFSRSSQASKMTQRQRRRRQEYLDAFDRCSRFIPCWVLTTSQISDYLPSECLFDLVIIDESSQSDVTVLPSLLRGKQWLVVGDGKQVSPTECFVSEEQIDSLRAALPSSPLENSLLPGHSFFDMCSQAFPRGRVVLREHFRCAEEIISFSNSQFYDEHLVPLRLPTKSERLVPSIVDVKVDGVKSGKINEREADKIVELIQDLVNDPDIDAQSRSIGVISLIGDEQSRIIRGRLLDVIGPSKMARHQILVGDPPTFQGAERDIIFLSMVCSKGSVPTQNQLMHFQRANVALSRARDKCVLVRSIESSEVPSFDDIKIPIIEFFQESNVAMGNGDPAHTPVSSQKGRKREGTELLKNNLMQRGYGVRAMGDVWRNAISVEEPGSDTRAAILVDCEGESRHEWRSSFLQQKAIERVGWKCLRMDALSLFVDFNSTLDAVMRFLSDAGIEPQMNEEEFVGAPGEAVDVEVEADDLGDEMLNNEEVAGDEEQEIVVISSDAESIGDTNAAVKPDAAQSASSNFGPHDEFDAAQYGDVVDLGFLKDNSDDEDLKDLPGSELAGKQADDSSSAYHGDQSDAGGGNGSPRKRRRKYSRLGKDPYDGRWYPNRSESTMDDEDGDLKEQWYDTESDLRDTEDQDGDL